MKIKILVVVAVGLPVAAMAQDGPSSAKGAPPAIKAGANVRTSDGWTIGRIEYVSRGKDGTPSDVAIIYNGRMIHLPAATLTAGDKDSLVAPIDHKHVG